jgi:hypothetical protein
VNCYALPKCRDNTKCKHDQANTDTTRANVSEANQTKARSEYQEFLTLRKDADPDISILKQAKVDYAKLK